ncbi:MAG TPA: hypothetical protein VER11_20190 [Polyangiaceae bacterium]|nr:hypothetical protein [Polyangiaceae bacterium]
MSSGETPKVCALSVPRVVKPPLLAGALLGNEESDLFVAGPGSGPGLVCEPELAGNAASALDAPRMGSSAAGSSLRARGPRTTHAAAAHASDASDARAPPTNSHFPVVAGAAGRWLLRQSTHPELFAGS